MPNVPFYLLYPITWSYLITDRFNAPRSYPFAPTKLQQHEGIDFAPRQPITETLYVRASQRGIIDNIGFSAVGYGNYVRIVHQWGDERYATWYGHLSQVQTTVNKVVNAGDIIGIAGSTGNSTGTHVHLTLQHIGKGLKNYVVDDVIDPEPLLRSSALSFDEAWWIADVTIPDGTEITAGQPFRKTWRLLNAGTTTWRSGYQLTFFKDNQMSGVSNVALPAAKPGEEVDISVDLVAPTTPGIQRSTWKPRTDNGTFFDYTQYAEIVIKSSAPQPSLDEARYVDDITIPDGMAIKPGEAFRKTWRIRNSGQTEWGDGYTFAFFSGVKMSGSDSVPLPRTPAGSETNISVDLIAPTTPGLLRCTYKPRDGQGVFFEFEMYAEINVLTATVDGATLVSHVIVLKPGQTFVKTWRVQNSGQTRWIAGYSVVLVGGDALGAAATSALPETKAGANADVSITLTAPSAAGVYATQWRLRNPSGVLFGPMLSAQIEVKA